MTFLFTDIEGSTRLYHELGDAYVAVLEEHHRRLRAAIGAHHGVEVKTEGDAFFVAFADPADAVGTCLDAQRALAEDGWPHGAPVRVRMGVHTGPVNIVDNDYVGLSVHEAARVASAAHGGQVLVSEATAGLVDGRLPAAVELRDLGRHALKDFPQPRHLFQLTHPDLGLAFPPPRTLTARGHNLPSPAASFVGRASELAEVQRLVLGSDRLVSIVGSGGMGKSRLAIELGWSVLSWFTEGVWFVGLADVGGPAGIVPAMCDALGVVDTPGVALEDALRQRLSVGPTLLIADNLEHLPDAGPRLGDLLESCPPLTVLATSRERLRIAGEAAFSLEPLTLPNPSDAHEVVAASDAVRLFTDRATAITPSFVIDALTAPAVIEICHRLDGVPLALELAAARVFDMPVSVLAARLGAALDVLTEGERDLPTRQQTLRATLAWSHDLLKPDARDLLASMSVFAGGATVPAIQAVHRGPDVPRLLDSLADANIVRHGATRWWMLETVRQFAAEQLAASGLAEARVAAHVEWALMLASDAAPRLTGPDQAEWLDTLEIEQPNLDGAMERAAPPERLAIAARLIRYWSARGHWTAGRAALDAALAGEGGEPADRAEALMGAGHLAMRQLDLDAAAERLAAGAELAESEGRLVIAAHCHNQLGELARIDGDPKGEVVEKRLALGFAREAGDVRTTAVVLGDLAVGRVRGHDPAAALTLFVEALGLHRQAGSLLDIAQTLVNIGTVHLALGAVQPARSAVTESIEIAGGLGDERTLANARGTLARIELADGHLAAGVELALQQFSFAERAGDLESGLRAFELMLAMTPSSGLTKDVAQRLSVMGVDAGVHEMVGHVARLFDAAVASRPDLPI